MIDRNGNTATLSYSGNNLAQVTDAVGRTLTFTYFAAVFAGARLTAFFEAWLRMLAVILATSASASQS